MRHRPSRRHLLKQGLLGAGFFVPPFRSAPAVVAPPRVTRQALGTMVFGYQTSQMLHVAAKLKIADLLEKGPRTTADLAAETGTDADALYRLLRALASIGIFTELDGRRFRLNAASEYLRADVPESVRVAAEIAGEEWMWRPWGGLLLSVTTGKTAFDQLYGMGTFDWFAQHPDSGRLFDEGQAVATTGVARAVVDAADLSQARLIVDVGGGDGTLLSTALRVNPSARGVLFDLAAVVDAARRTFDPAVAPRTEFVGGDFFKAIPTSADVYLMKSILHDWDDGDCRRILSVTRRAMAATAHLLVVEDLVCAPNQPCAAKAKDLNMLVRTGGRNRTEKEYRDLLAQNGFRTSRILPTASTLFVIEARPA